MALSICAVFSCTKNDNETNGGNEPGGGGGEPQGSYVDLGLPSGTKWKNANEENSADAEYDFYTYDEAIAAFGDKLPTKEQCEELKGECQWTWNGSGYEVTGPNGNSISLPAADCRLCSGDVYGVGSGGYYWSSTPSGSEFAWILRFDSGSVGVSVNRRCCGQSVRLVQD